jgi:hypothetical protein
VKALLFHEINDVMFFYFKVNDAQHFITILNVYVAGSYIKVITNCLYYEISFPVRGYIGFENTDHSAGVCKQLHIARLKNTVV